jgi:hypothetical protein
MSRSGLKGAAVGVASLLLVLLGAHLAWEHNRVRLHTLRGTIRIGMTRAEARAILGPATFKGSSGGAIVFEDWAFGEWDFMVRYDDDGRVKEATFTPNGRPASRIPRPCLVEHVRSGLAGKKE